MWSDDFERLKTQVDLLEIVQNDVGLKKSGKTYKALCPFHDEKTPSFTVYPKEQKFYCFGCEAQGDIIDYIQKINQIPTPIEALKHLASQYQVPLQGIDEAAIQRKKKAVEKNRSQYKTYYDEKDKAYEYLESRGINKQTGEKFVVGYDQKNDAVTIPIKDTYGQLVGIAERYLSDEAKAKYKNSPETEVYKKSELLFGLHECRKDISEQVYVVEGYFDVLAMHEAGIGKTVAYAGQSLTEQQSKLLSHHMTDRTKIYLIPDKDTTGQNFIKKNIKTIRLYSRNRISVVDLPGGCKDINDFLLIGGDFHNLPVIPFEMFLLKQDLNNCMDIEDEYEVTQAYAKSTTNEMIRADMAEYLAKRWKKPIDLVRSHMKGGKQIADYSRKLHTATESYAGFVKNVNEGDAGKVFTNFKEIDNHIKGIKPGEVMTIMGRSGAGKTTFAVNLIYNVVFNQKQNVVFNSLELAKENVIPQFLQIRKKAPLHRVESLAESGKQDDDIDFLLETMDRHYRIADEDSQTLHDLEQYILAANDSVFEEPVKAIFVDYFQYMKPEDHFGKQRHEKMAEIAKGLKALAKRRDVVVFALSQANRDEGRDGSDRLSKSSPGETKAIEDSSDYLLGIRRTAASTKISEDERMMTKNEMYCQILKNRWGYETEIPLYYEGMTKRIEDSNGRITLKSLLEKD